MVDDNPRRCYSTARILRAAGFEVIEADTGSEALRRPRSTTSASSCSTSTCRTSTASRSAAGCARAATPRHLPVVHLSATFVTHDDKVTGLDAGADGYLTHPVEPPVLVATVRALLFARQRGHHAARDASALPRHLRPRLERHRAARSTSWSTSTSTRRSADSLGPRARATSSASAADLIAPRHDDVCKTLHQALGRRPALAKARCRCAGPTAAWPTSSGASRRERPGVRIAIATDVTERRASTARERARRAHRGRAHNRLKDEFLATLSHELRKPLNAIARLGAACSSATNVTPRDDRAGHDAIERNSRVQSQLIEDLLDFAGIRSGKMRLDVDAIVARAHRASPRSRSVQLAGAEQGRRHPRATSTTAMRT